MTKEEIIDWLEIYTVGRLKKDRVYITVEELQKFIDEIKSLEQEQTQKIDVIPKDYVYDTETEAFVVYRHKYTGEEIHIKKPILVYTLEQEPSEDIVMDKNYWKGFNNGIRTEKFRESKRQQSSDDCIDREEVKKFVEYIQTIKDNHNEKGSPINYGTICDIVIKAHRLLDSPSVTPVQRWIPVSEKLPEEDGEYLLFGKIDEDEENYIFIGEYDSCGEQFGIWQEQFDRTTLGYIGSDFFEYSSVVAWMPLPEEPYREVEE